jgi:hypothetical protein
VPRNRSISSAIAAARSAANGRRLRKRCSPRSAAAPNRSVRIAKMDPRSPAHRCALPGDDGLGRASVLNKRSIKPAGYGERFVKRHGLFSVARASLHGVVSGCVSRQGNDRSAVHQLD